MATFDEDYGWWAGIQRCGATLALAAAMSVTVAQAKQSKQVFSYHQDDPGGANLHVVPDDIPWLNYVAPVPRQNWQKLPYFFDTPEIVAQPPPFRPDDDSWTNPAAHVWAQSQKPVYAYVTDEIVLQSATFLPDEDYWPNPVPPALTWWKSYVFAEANTSIAAVVPLAAGIRYLPVFRRRRR
jgi:hypothetical protein